MTEDSTKKPYKRRITDKRREQNRAAQRAWRDKQKKELEALKTLAEANDGISASKGKAAPPQTSEPPFAEYINPVRDEDIGETDMMCALSLEHWGRVAACRQNQHEIDTSTSHTNAPNGQHSNEQIHANVITSNIAIQQPAAKDEVDFTHIDGWDTSYDYSNVGASEWHTSFAPAFQGSNTQIVQKAGHSILPGWLDVNMSDTCAFDSAMAPELVQLPDFTIPADFRVTEDYIMNAVATTSTTSTTFHINTPDSSAWACVPTLTRNIRIHSISIHLACVENARMLGVTPESAFRTEFCSRFYRAPTGPPTFNDTIASSNTSNPDTLWYDQGKDCGWKNIKKCLRPTPAQLIIPHDLWIDTLPFPTIRERMLMLLHDIDAPDLANDMAFHDGLICWAHGDGQGGGVGSGTPWDVRNWEVKPWFISKWWASGVLGDEDGEVWEQCVWWAQWRKDEGEDVQDLEILMRDFQKMS